MTDALEQELRAALAERASAMPDAADAFERLRHADYHARVASRPRRLPAWLPVWLPLWPVLGGGAAALGAGIATAVVLLSSGATPAYAGWTPVPATPSPAALATMKTACERDAGPLLSTAMTGELMLADQRGSYIAALYANGTDAGVCFWSGGSSAGGSGTDEQIDDPPGPDQLGLWSAFSAPTPGPPGSGVEQSQSSMQHLLNSPYFKDHPAVRAGVAARLRAMEAASMGMDVYGRAGSDVAAVSFIIYGGVTVRATVENGWYFAWWPVPAAGRAGLWAATSVTVTTRSGATISSPMLGASRCSAPCVFAGITPRPALAGSSATSTTTTVPAASAITPGSTTATSPATTATGGATATAGATTTVTPP